MTNSAYQSCLPGYTGNAVNIMKSEDGYILHLFAPGLARESFDVSTHGDILYIRYLGDGLKGRFTRKEYEPAQFQRSFSLKGRVDVNGITASYSDGVLQVMLPGRPTVRHPLP